MVGSSSSLSFATAVIIIIVFVTTGNRYDGHNVLAFSFSSPHSKIRGGSIDRCTASSLLLVRCCSSLVTNQNCRIRSGRRRMQTFGQCCCLSSININSRFSSSNFSLSLCQTTNDEDYALTDIATRSGVATTTTKTSSSTTSSSTTSTTINNELERPMELSNAAKQLASSSTLLPMNGESSQQPQHNSNSNNVNNNNND